MITCDVAVVGGGPVGMWLAAELHRGGVRPVVLERRAQRLPYSKALTIYPRTAEQFAMRGLVGRWLAEGTPVPSSHFALLKNRLDFSFLDTRYPYTLFLPQRRTEELLEEHLAELGVPYLRQHAVTGLRQDEAGVDLDVDTPEGPAAVRAAYAVGCDGASSVVRAAAGIEFEGTPDSWQSILGDIEMTDPPAGAALSLNQPGGSLYVIAIGGGRHRLAVIDHATLQDPADRPVTIGDLKASALRLAGTDFGMRETPDAWLSRVGNATRQAARYRAGRILLAGDAAHIHFPAGGQGLNLGLQDATNLGWKLAAEIRGWAPPGLLDSYHAERAPVGLAVIDDALAQCGLLANPSREGIALRDRFNAILGAHQDLCQELAIRLSGLAIRYPPDTLQPAQRPPDLDPLAAQGPPDLDPLAGEGPPDLDPLAGQKPLDVDPLAAQKPLDVDPLAAQKPLDVDPLAAQKPLDLDLLVGQRAPDLDLRGAPASTVYGLLHPAKFVLLGLGSAPVTPPGFAGRLDTVTAQPVTAPPDWDGVRAVLIRPDGYIAWASRTTTTTATTPPLATWLGAPAP